MFTKALKAINRMYNKHRESNNFEIVGSNFESLVLRLGRANAMAHFTCKELRGIGSARAESFRC